MRLGYIGPFGDSNFGDYAMLINDILDIDKKNISIFTYDLENTKSICNEYLKDFDIEYVFIDIEKPEINYGKDYVIEYNTYPFIPLEIYNKIKNANQVFKKIREIDKLVVIGGGYFNHLWNAKHRQYKLLAIMGTILIANDYKKKIYFLGNTYGPFFESIEMFKIFFSSLKTAIISTRDNVFSPLWFETVSKKELYLVPDDLYFLNRRFNPTQYEVRKHYLILEVYYSITELENDIELYKSFVQKIKKAYDLDVIFLPFDKNYGGENQGKYLCSKIDELKYFTINNDKFLRIEDTLGIVKGASFVICNRYHLFVFAIANNIPVIQILKNVLGNKTYYYTKSKGVLNHVFKNQDYEENLFFTTSTEECFNFVSDRLHQIIEKQNRLFNDLKIENEKLMIERRKEFIKLINND